MKNTTKATLITAISTTSCILLLQWSLLGSANAGLWDSMMNSGLKEVTPTANYEMAVYGYDARVYEWTPAWNQGISCVFIASNKSSGVACYPKALTE